MVILELFEWRNNVLHIGKRAYIVYNCMKGGEII